MKFHSLVLAFSLLACLQSFASDIIVDPRVNGVLRSYDLLGASGDFYRVILTNTELEPCMIIDKVNLRDEKKGPRVLESFKFCSFEIKGKKYSLLPDQQQEVEILEVAWEKSKLKFSMNYTSTEKAAASRALHCLIDPKKSKKDFSCE